jgi:hypothetical protein
MFLFRKSQHFTRSPSFPRRNDGHREAFSRRLKPYFRQAKALPKVKFSRSQFSASSGNCSGGGKITTTCVIHKSFHINGLWKIEEVEIFPPPVKMG